MLPVRGWTAKRIPEKVCKNGQIIPGTWLILECPEFVRDACEFGTKRIDKETCGKCAREAQCVYRWREGGRAR